ncbi:MAG: hypothetical protein GX051_09515 [Clostridiales bacterium]|nr:hypothetical protein [Clostridiales bacterium]
MKNSKKVILKTASVILSATVVVATVLFFPLNGKEHIQIWSASDEFNISEIRTVEKTPGKPFKILVLADTQLWSSPSQNKQCFGEIEALVSRSQPDFIVMVGDNVSGVTARFDIDKLIKLMDSFKIPWAPVFGNHDNEIPMNSLNWQGDKYEEAEYCVFGKGPSNLYGCGNYAVNITENGKAIETLFLLDNGRYIKYDDGSTKEIYMGYEQMAWYKWNVEGIAKTQGKAVPSMVFTHFAPPEMREAVEKLSSLDEGSGVYTVKPEYGSGKCTYLPSSAPVDSGFFDLCKTLGSTKHMFFGHDHENTASLTFEGITMTYALKTGVSPKPWNFAEQTGGTLITLTTADGEVNTDIENIVITG